MAQAVQFHATQAGGLAGEVVAPTQSRDVEPSAPAVADDVVIVGDEVVPGSEPGEGS